MIKRVLPLAAILVFTACNLKNQGEARLTADDANNHCTAGEIDPIGNPQAAQLDDLTRALEKIEGRAEAWSLLAVTEGCLIASRDEYVVTQIVGSASLDHVTTRASQTHSISDNDMEKFRASVREADKLEELVLPSIGGPIYYFLHLRKNPGKPIMKLGVFVTKNPEMHPDGKKHLQLIKVFRELLARLEADN